jgi:ketosteroid isomerase-like protein
VRSVWSAALAPFDGPVELELRELDVTASGDVAFARCVGSFGGTVETGAHLVNWLRFTFAFRRAAGRWKLVHQHVSVPFDMVTRKALLDVEPG